MNGGTNDELVPVDDYATRTKGIIRALYPGLEPLPWLILMDVRTWDDAGPMNVIDFELCAPSREQRAAREPCPCPNPMLKGNVTFDYSAEDKYLVSIRITGAAATARQDKFGDLARKNLQWSEVDVVRALEGAGAKYGPDKKDLLVRSLPLTELEPYVGDLKVKSAQFDAKKPSEWIIGPAPDLGVCLWFVRVTAPAPGGKERLYSFAVEPFEGRVINILEKPTAPPEDPFKPQPPP
jgi:hypothetical protein